MADYKKIEFSCAECKSQVTGTIPDICLRCFSKQMIYPRKKKTYHFKLAAYTAILYMLPCLFIARKYGLPTELLYVAGGIHITILPHVCYWLEKKF